MRTVPHRSAPISVFAIGAALLWGLIEFVALCRSRWASAWQRLRHRR